MSLGGPHVAFSGGASGGVNIITADTSSTGVPLVDSATGVVILSVMAPNDGRVHAILCASFTKVITATLTGGSVTLSWTPPGVAQQVISTTETAIGHVSHSVTEVTTAPTMKPGSSLVIKQGGMSAGSGIVYAKIVIA